MNFTLSLPIHNFNYYSLYKKFYPNILLLMNFTLSLPKQFQLHYHIHYHFQNNSKIISITIPHTKKFYSKYYS